MHCAICDSNNLDSHLVSKDYLSGRVFEVKRCAVCHTLQTSFPTEAGSMKKYYPDEYFDNRKSFVDGYINKIRAQGIEQRVDGNKRYSILDVGCGSGTFLETLPKEKWDRQGTELSSMRIADAQEKHITVHFGELEQCDFEDSSFDVVTLWHVLEHLVDPKRTLQEVHRILRKDGLVAIEVPNSDSWQARFGGALWFHLDVPRHLFHFSHATLASLLEAAEFRIIKTSYFSPFYDMFGTVQTLINRVTGRTNLLFDLLNGKIQIGSAIRTYPMDTLATIALLPIASLVALPLFAVGLIFNQGGVMTVYARKR